MFLLKGHTIESMYSNIYKKPRVNLKEEIWEGGGRQMIEKGSKMFSHCKPNRPTTRLTSCFWKGRKYRRFEKFRNEILWNIMRRTSALNWQHPWREVLGKITVVQVKFTLEQSTKAHRWSRVQLYSFCNLGARLGSVVNATPRPLYLLERPDTNCIGGWVGPRAGLDGCGKSRTHRDSNPGPSRP